MTFILGIETSCDETAAAVVSADKRILSNLVRSQWEEHRPYGGVVPEIAARSHIDALDTMVSDALRQAGLRFNDLSGVAVTAGPGLIGGLMVGIMTAKAIAAFHQLPFIAVNHLEGHALTSRLTGDIPFPFLLLLVSGGHCQILSVEGVGRYRRLGGTLDDALGEAFDKVAKMMGLPYPGGPEIEKQARLGNPKAYIFPKPLYRQQGCDFSFSGLKTAVRHRLQALHREDGLNANAIADISASFQHTVGQILADRLQNAIALYREIHHGAGQTLVVAGGVSANLALRNTLASTASEQGFSFAVAPIALCTDNAAMIAWAGMERLQGGLTDKLDFEPKARWPLDQISR